MKLINSLKKSDMTAYVEEITGKKNIVLIYGCNSYNDLHKIYNQDPKVVKKGRLENFTMDTYNNRKCKAIIIK